MSTFWIMGMTDQFEQGRKWIDNHFKPKNLFNGKFTGENLNKKNFGKLEFYDKPYRYLGSLLSCYALTKDGMFLKKAIEIAEIWNPNFDEINEMDRFSSELLERHFLANETKELKYLEKITTFQNYLNEQSALDLHTLDNIVEAIFIEGLKYFNIFELFIIIIFLFYAVKLYIQSNNNSPSTLSSLKLYRRYINEAIHNQKHLIHIKLNNTINLTFFDSNLSSIGINMLDCYFGALLYIGECTWSKSLAKQNLTQTKLKAELSKIKLNQQLAITIIESCSFATNLSSIKLSSAQFHYPLNITICDNKISKNSQAGSYNQFEGKDEKCSSTLLENSYFYNQFNTTLPIMEYSIFRKLSEIYFLLWRETHHQKYRNYAWELAKIIDQQIQLYPGIFGLPPINNNQNLFEEFKKQQILHLGTTLKYLYLIFSSDQLLPTNQWVFNNDGHPVPINF